MLTALLANAGPFWGYGIGELLIGVVIFAACVGLVYIALDQFGVAIPPFVVRVFWVVICAVVVIFAIRLVLSL